MIFFITLFRYFTIVLFFTLHFFSFSQGMQTRERAHCARSVFPFIKKKIKNKTYMVSFSYSFLQAFTVLFSFVCILLICLRGRFLFSALAHSPGCDSLSIALRPFSLSLSRSVSVHMLSNKYVT